MSAPFERSSSLVPSFSSIHIGQSSREHGEDSNPFRRSRNISRRRSPDSTTFRPASRRITTLEIPPSGDNPPAFLPFSRNDDGLQPQRDSLRECPSKKKHPPGCNSPRLTADAAYKMVTKLTSEKEQELRQSMDAKASNCDSKPRRRATVPSCNSNAAVKSGQKKHGGFRQDYVLGENMRSLSHMIIEPTSQRAMEAVDSLQKHDFAFVKRSNESYSYAILAYRSMEPIKGATKSSDGLEECMVFLMDDGCSTKMVRRSRWSEYIRLAASTEELNYPPRASKEELKYPPHHDVDSTDISNCQPSLMLCQEIPPVTSLEMTGGANKDDKLPPSMISFIRQNVEHEECSMISSVSDRCRFPNIA